MNSLSDPPPVDYVDAVGHYRHLLSVAAAVVREDGHLIDCNAGFRRLLQARLSADSDHVAPFFFRPGFYALTAMTAGRGQPVYQGQLTIGDNQVGCTTLVGTVHRAGANLIVLAEFDIAEMENLNAQVLQFNEQLIDMQRQLARNERQLRASEARLTELSLTDALTGLANRRHLEQFTQAAVKREERFGETFSLIMLDLDHFKRINDAYGHEVGDTVLCHSARLMRGAVREIDLAARIGGEEFVLVLSATTLEEAASCAERLRSQLASLRPPGLEEDVSASFGVVQYDAPGDLAGLLKQADTALYRAKNAGRNRVVCCDRPV
jgi:two-component system cell cycle response regulator